MRTTIKAHSSGFCFARSSRGSSPELTSLLEQFFSTLFPPLLCNHFELGPAELRCHDEPVWEVPASRHTSTCVRECVHVCVCVFMCDCLDADVRVSD